MSPRSASVIRVAVSVTVTLLLVACSRGTEAEPSHTASESVSAEPTNVAGTPSGSDWVGDASWDYSSDDGYSYTLTLTVGEPRKFNPDGDNLFPDWPDTAPEDEYGFGGEDLLADCIADPARDAAVPLFTAAEITTPGDFDTPVSAGFIIDNLADVDSGNFGASYEGNVQPPTPETVVAQISSENTGTICLPSEPGGVDGVGSTWLPAETGSTVTGSSWVILRGFYSPAAPEGDLALLDWATLIPNGRVSDRDGVRIEYYPLDQSSNGSFRSDRGLTLAGNEVRSP